MLTPFSAFVLMCQAAECNHRQARLTPYCATSFDFTLCLTLNHANVLGRWDALAVLEPRGWLLPL